MTALDGATDSGLPDDLPAELNILLGVHFLYRKTNDVMDATGARSMLSTNERGVLLLLDTPKRMGVLAAWMQVLPSTLTSIADDLEAKGFVTRERSPEDRRAWRLCLTRAGVAQRREIIETIAKMFADLSGLGRTEMDQMSAQMLKIARNIAANGLPEGTKSCP